MKSFIFIFLLSSVPFWSCGKIVRSGAIDTAHLKEAWDANNDPRLLKDYYEVRLLQLPTSAELDRKPWTDTYWPSYRGGIANRWNDSSGPDSFSYPLAGQQQLRTMSIDELKKLSPAEKYDILQGRLDYPLVKEERARTSPNHPTWYGLCHGWAPAALNFDEPNPITVRSNFGFEVPFGSSDVKALLIFAQHVEGGARMLGQRCEYDLEHDPSHANDPACRDTNAGSFHIVLANQIGLLKEGFVADVARGFEVWNQPVFGYQSTITDDSTNVYPQAAPGTVRVVTVFTKLRFISEIGAYWDPKPFAEFPYQEGNRSLKYTLELNQANEIIGGEWLTQDRPDFLWTQKKPRFSGYLARIASLYQSRIPR